MWSNVKILFNEYVSYAYIKGISLFSIRFEGIKCQRCQLECKDAKKKTPDLIEGWSKRQEREKNFSFPQRIR